MLEFRIKYKICLLTFNLLRGHGPENMSEMLTPRSTDYGIRSQDDLTLDVPRTKKENTGRSCFYSCCTETVELPPKDVRSCDNVSIFKSKLKTQYFRIAYN